MTLLGTRVRDICMPVSLVAKSVLILYTISIYYDSAVWAKNVLVLLLVGRLVFVGDDPFFC